MIRLDRRGQLRGVRIQRRVRDNVMARIEDLAWLLLGSMLLVGVYVLLGYFLLPYFP